MKFSSNLLSLAALAAFPGVVEAGEPTCDEQSSCVEFSMTELDTDACGVGGACTVEVCMLVSGGLDGCGKGAGKTFSHMCMQSNSSGCPVWVNNDGVTPLLGAGNTEECSDVSALTGEGALAAFDGKCETGSDIVMCQEGAPGDTLYWILKDGNDKSGVVEDKTYTMSVNGCDDSVRCFNNVYSCGNNAEQKLKERTWSYTIPDGTGTCPSVCSAPPTWTTFAERTSSGAFTSDISPARLTAHMNNNPNAIIHFHCPSCSRDTHKDVYYKRVTPVPDQAAYDADSGYAVDFVDLFTKNWASTPSNAIATDFNLYSTYEDAVAGINAWTYCNYDDDWVGFPRDCGPTGWVPGQWVSIHRGTFTFSVTGEVPVLVEEPSVWTTFASKGAGVFSAEYSGAALTAHMNADPDAIIKRTCNDCWHSAFKTIYYKRLTPVPDQAAFDADSGHAKDFVNLFTGNWMSTPSNVLNVDFKLYSTYEDAVLDNKGWKFCNYDDDGVGFPRDCGPDKLYGGQWINDKSWGKGFTFEVTGELEHLVDPPAEWTTFASRTGSEVSNPVSAARLAAHVNTNGAIIRRLCPSCSSADHKEIFYKRITPVPEQDAFTNADNVFDFVDLFAGNWMSEPDNKINEDFKLFSSYEAAVLDHSGWTYCNYDGAGVGFPRDCGPTKWVPGQWTSSERWSKDYVFQVEGKVLFNELDAVWTEVCSVTGGTFAENDDVTPESFAAHVEQEGAIVHRSCPSCADSHKDIYYRRLTAVPSQSDFDGETPDNFLDLFVDNWFSTPSNVLDVDFKLYGSYDDAVEDVNAWTFCNYDDEHIGFPRDCGVTSSTAGQWNSKSRGDGKDYTLRVSGVVPLPGYNQWDLIASSTNNVKTVELDDTILRQHLATTNGIIRRFCPGCWNSLHKEIYYKRLTPLPDPSEFDGKTPDDFLDLFLNNWFSEPKNVLNVDFELYSTYLDARTGQNKWTYCNYNDATVGFPRDCGPQGFLPNGWTSMTRWSRDFTFEVEGNFEPIIAATSLPGATEWTIVAEETHTTKTKYYASEEHVMTHVVESTNGIIRRICDSCRDSHKEIYYRRLSDFPTREEYRSSGSAASSFMDMMINNWYSYPRNVLDTDFALFSTYQDALAGINAWNYCNYNHAGVGFPRDCGPSGYVPSQWTSFERNTGRKFSFAVEGTVPPEPELEPLADQEGWTGVARKSAGIPYQCLTDAEFRAQMEATNGIVRRLCPSCTNPTHREIYYRRTSPIPEQSAFETSDAKNFLDLFLDNWMKEPFNELNVDFELYSTYEDARSGRNKWTFCNFDDGGVGFPRDCGPYGYVPSQWTSTSRRSPDFVFEVEGQFDTEEECKPPPKACVATGWGDPHMITFDGLKYDAHALGEVIMMMSQDSDLMVQARLERVAGHSADPAATTGVAIRENPLADGTEFPLVQVSMASGDNVPLTLFSCPVELYVDKVKQDDLSAGYHANDVKVEVHMNTGRIHIEYPDLQLNLKVLKFMGLCHFTVTYALLNDCRPEERIIGLLGSPDDDATNDWMKRDGSVVDLPSGGLSSFFFGPAYEYVTQNWCIYIESESLFTYQPGYDFSYYEHCGVDYNPELELSLEDATPEQIERCGEGNQACLFEAVNLGDGAADEAIETPGIDEEEPEEIQVLKTEAAELTFNLPDIVLQVPDTPPAGGNCPVCRAVGWGDPHIITFDGVSYDVHVKGELTFLKSTDPENDFTIQARTVAVKNHPRGPAVTSGVVVHKTGEPTIQVSLGNDGSSLHATNFMVSGNVCPVQLFVNGQARDITTGSGLTGATVQVKGNRIVVEYLDLQMRMDMQVRSWRDECHFSVTYFLADCPCDGSLVGILGQPDGEWSNDWHEHDGTPVDIPGNRRQRRGRKAYDYSLTWCLAAEDSKFEYEPNMSHGDFDKCTGTKGDDNYDVDVDKIIQEAEQETPEIIEKCTTDGVLDEGCVMECVYLGDGACDEYVEIVQNTATAEIPERPDTPDDAPGEIPDLPDLDDAGGDDPTDPGTSDNENSSPTEGAEIPSDSAGSNGDPHFRTWNNEHFEYHGQCDLVLAKDPKFADGLGLQVQIRTKLVRFWSYIKSAAIRIGDDILEIQGAADPEDGVAEYWMNLEYQAPVKTLGGFPVTVNVRSHKKRIFTIDLSSKYPGQMIQIKTFREFIKVDFQNASEESFGNAVGMLGDLKTGKLLGRDGTEITDFYELGAQWQVRPDEDMLFNSIEDPQFPKACVIPEDPQGDRRRRLDEQSVSIEQAEAACAGLKNPLDRKDCVYDILATQDLDMAGAF